MALQCWMGLLSFENCCYGPWHIGNVGCWDGPYQWDSCCRPVFEAQGTTKESYDKAIAQGLTLLPLAPETQAHFEEQSAKPSGTFHTRGFSVSDGAPPWMQSFGQCLSQYDDPESRRWFLAHSGLPSHFVAHVGNPAACKDGGHKFYWGLLIVKMNLAGNAWQEPIVSDVATEFGICVPKSCGYEFTDAVIAPFYLGPYFQKPWGPQPESMHRFSHFTGSFVQGADNDKIGASVSKWMSDIIGSNGGDFRAFYEREWPFQRQLWEYKSTWWPSPQNESVLLGLLLPPLLAGLCICCGCVSSASVLTSAASNTKEAKFPDHGVATKVRSAVSLVVNGFAPQTCIGKLVASSDNDVIGMHILRIILQLIVCWQHVILFVDWLGNSGHAGTARFLPITNSVAVAASRVNTVFACVTMHLSFESIIRLLRSADSQVATSRREVASASIEPQSTNGETAHDNKAVGASNGHKKRDMAASSAPQAQIRQAPAQHLSIAKASCILCVWCVRRWVHQVTELALWTFYFTEVSQDIPWKPFPDFVQVWYKDRRLQCRRSLSPSQWQLPMWLLSLFFVYEPVNSVLELHDQSVSLCHNMQVFEHLFAVSLLGALLGTVRHCFGRRSSFALALFYAIATVRWDPRWPGGNPEFAEDDMTTSTLSMLPAGVLTTLLLLEFPAKAATKIVRSRVAVGIIAIGSLLDLIALGQAATLAEMIQFQALRQPLVALISMGLRAMRWQFPMFFWFVREGIHAVGVAALLHSFRNTAEEAKSFSSVARCVARLSLGINLTNIFAIHYIRGRTLDHPVEFAQFHGVLYAVFAWIAAAIVSLIAHCMVAPYASAADVALSRVHRMLVAPRPANAERMTVDAVDKAK